MCNVVIGPRLEPSALHRPGQQFLKHLPKACWSQAFSSVSLNHDCTVTVSVDSDTFCNLRSGGLVYVAQPALVLPWKCAVLLSFPVILVAHVYRPDPQHT